MKSITKYFILFIIIFQTPALILADQLSKPGCSIDMNIQTRSYETEVSSVDIEPSTTAYMNDTITLAIVAQEVSNLDTYQLDVTFDPSKLVFLKGYSEVPSYGIQNFLKTNGGSTIGFQAFEKSSGVISIVNTLVGKNMDQAPEGSGILAILRFKLLEDGQSQIQLKNIHFLDSNQTLCPVQQINKGQIN
jgi:hypothetical protein